MQVMPKVLTTGWFFITCLLIFMHHILSFLSHILFCFYLFIYLFIYLFTYLFTLFKVGTILVVTKSILNQF